MNIVPYVDKIAKSAEGQYVNRAAVYGEEGQGDGVKEEWRVSHNSNCTVSLIIIIVFTPILISYVYSILLAVVFTRYKTDKDNLAWTESCSLVKAIWEMMRILIGSHSSKTLDELLAQSQRGVKSEHKTLINLWTLRDRLGKLFVICIPPFSSLNPSPFSPHSSPHSSHGAVVSPLPPLLHSLYSPTHTQWYWSICPVRYGSLLVSII